MSSLPPLQYAESKLGLEALCHKWGSEGWGDYVSIAGAVIGWTRGTGLMADNNGEELSWALFCPPIDQAAFHPPPLLPQSSRRASSSWAAARSARRRWPSASPPSSTRSWSARCAATLVDGRGED